jgi:hypothetical protein
MNRGRGYDFQFWRGVDVHLLTDVVPAKTENRSPDPWPPPMLSSLNERCYDVIDGKPPNDMKALSWQQFTTASASISCTRKTGP